MKRFAPFAALVLVLSAACTPTGTTGSPTTAAPSARPATSAPPSAPASATTLSSTEPKPSLKETSRLDRELGSAVVPYPFTNCAVIQKPFDASGPKHRRVYKGHEVLFCCTPCVRAFDSNPEPYMPRIIAAAAAAVPAGQ